jgi:putative Holliday junction resolvase
VSRILAVDPGEVRIGLAISDPTGTIAKPLEVLSHTSRSGDAAAIAEAAAAHGAKRIVVGVALDEDGQVGHQARRSLRLVEAIRQTTPIPVETWDESGTTQAALTGRGPDELLDARAAAYLLQDYLESEPRGEASSPSNGSASGMSDE